MVYFIQAIDGGQIKIGTTIRLSERLKQLTNECGKGLRVLAVIEGSIPEERSLHQRFSHLKAFGEWFEPGDDLVGFIVESGREWDGTDDIPLRRNDEAVRIRSDVAAKARIAAAFAGESIMDYISDILDPILTKAINEGYAKINKGTTSNKPKRSDPHSHP